MPDNKTLAARLKARERSVEACGHVFIVRRPKAAEMVLGMTKLELVRRFVVGWDLKNIDLVPGGTPDPEPFDAALWADYLEDNDSLWPPLTEAILGLWNEHLAAKEAAEKN